ncbi:MAG: hypothetical protein EOP10_05355 [Proteobacteria bacterium]|nr:MAG: hypothetical protein EOP10_05355 [Pseudomonadota bacterium]
MMNAFAMPSFSSVWSIFLLFALPVGGGIPGGVILAQKLGFGWVPMSAIYLVSDIVLALLFEPMLRLFAYLARYFAPLAKFIEVSKMLTDRTIARYGSKPSLPLLIAISFGIDPMSGRAVALAAGHRFISGWAIAIAGDMIFFAMIAVSTIYLGDLLGDGTWAAVIIMAAMIVIPFLVRLVREQRTKKI